MRQPDAAQIAGLVGLFALLLILGALGFEYLGRLPPCEMCMWQRYPHIAAAIIGIAGYLALRSGLCAPSWSLPIAILTVGLVAISGAFGIYHAGVEWHWWPGPTECSGPIGDLNKGGSLMNQLQSINVVRCDEAAWRLFGISLAGYNALISLALAAFALVGLLASRPAAYASAR